MARKSQIKFNYPLVVGLTLISIFLVWRYHNLRILSFNTTIVDQTKSANIKPIYIKSYPIGIDVKIEDTSITNGIWTIKPNSANYLVTSAGIGDNGNIIIYGHNKNNILGPIRWMKTGDIIEITGSDNKIYKYKVEKTDTIDPNNLSYITPTDKEILTIYTCTGFLDSKRFIVRAYPL